MRYITLSALLRCLLPWVMLVCGVMQPTNAATPPNLEQIATTFTLTLPAGQGQWHYYVDNASAARNVQQVHTALVVMHGHPRDANISLQAAITAIAQAGHSQDTIAVAPLFQVANARHCQTEGVPSPQRNDALWSCSSWLSGEPPQHGDTSAFAVIDQLLADLQQRWPRLDTVVLAGFSAGAQFVQHYIGFARPPAGLHMRYVVADPGTWLYFDPVRPATSVDSKALSEMCPSFHEWKYGTNKLPAWLGRNAIQAKAHYARADIAYLEGELDQGEGRGTAYRLLDKSCAAQAQGPYRLQRGQYYANYDRQWIQPSHPHRLTTVPGCDHHVSCLLPSAARQALFPSITSQDKP